MNTSTEGNSTAPPPQQKAENAETPAAKKDPWAAARGAPSQEWEPQTWTPKPSQR